MISTQWFLWCSESLLGCLSHLPYPSCTQFRRLRTDVTFHNKIQFNGCPPHLVLFSSMLELLSKPISLDSLSGQLTTFEQLLWSRSMNCSHSFPTINICWVPCFTSCYPLFLTIVSLYLKKKITGLFLPLRSQKQNKSENLQIIIFIIKLTMDNITPSRAWL